MRNHATTCGLRLLGLLAVLVCAADARATTITYAFEGASFGTPISGTYSYDDANMATSSVGGPWIAPADAVRYRPTAGPATLTFTRGGLLPPITVDLSLDSILVVGSVLGQDDYYQVEASSTLSFVGGALITRIRIFVEAPFGSLLPDSSLPAALDFLANSTTVQRGFIWDAFITDSQGVVQGGSFSENSFLINSIHRVDGAVPEPGTLGLTCLVLVGLARRRRR